LLFDEARILEGDRPENPGKFSDRLAHVLRRSLLSTRP
jgi:HSP90 family molecular chaperone